METWSGFSGTLFEVPTMRKTLIVKIAVLIEAVVIVLLALMCLR